MVILYLMTEIAFATTIPARKAPIGAERPARRPANAGYLAQATEQ